jgi:hypothetical protein
MSTDILELSEPVMHGTSPDTPDNTTGNPSQAAANKGSTPQAQALLVGLVHLLGLFLSHSRSSFKARATSVLFDQLQRHMHLLETIPGHDGVITIRRVGGPVSPRTGSPNYHVSLGASAVDGMGSTLTVSGPDDSRRIRMDATLRQAFDCLASHGIDSIRLRLPGQSNDKVDQFRLSLNIIARFRAAVEKSATIVFRYFGRSTRVPVVADSLGRPDPNLTTMAGLNGMSSANARELVKQAEASRALATTDSHLQGDEPARPKSSYELIFSLASLSSQLVRPRIEINTLPWVMDSCSGPAGGVGNPPALPDGDDPELHAVDPRFAWRSFSVDRFRQPVTGQYLAEQLKTDDPGIVSAIRAVTANDFDCLGIREAGQRLMVATVVLNAIEQRSRDPLIIDRLIHHLQDQFMWVPEAVLTNISVQRKGIKLHASGKTLVVGMIHPRLLDMIVLVKSTAMTRQKMRTAEDVSFVFNYPNVRLLAERFGIDTNHALHLLGLLKSTIGSAGRFNRTVFESQSEELWRYGDTLFEIYFCLLKQMSRQEDRLSLLDAFPQLISRLNDPVRAIRFVLDNLFHPDHAIKYPDRNALVLANQLLIGKPITHSGGMQSTSDTRLMAVSAPNPDMLRYVRWRLAADKVYVGIVLERIQQAILHSLVAKPGARSMPASYLLALEREALVFLSLTGTGTARSILRRALLRYSDPQSAIYQKKFKAIYVDAVMDHLRTIILGIGRMGNPKDTISLEAVIGNFERLGALDPGTDYSRKTTQLIRTIEAAIQTIRSRSE